MKNKSAAFNEIVTLWLKAFLRPLNTNGYIGSNLLLTRNYMNLLQIKWIGIIPKDYTLL